MSRRLRRPEGGRSPVREAMIRYVAIGLAQIGVTDRTQAALWAKDNRV